MGTPRGGYYNAAGKKVPSVTTIISKSDDKSALIKWGYRTGCDHGALRTENRLILVARDAISDLGPDGGRIVDKMFGEDWDTREIVEAPADLYDVTQKAADAGSIAHDVIEYHVLNGELPVADGEWFKSHELWNKASDDVKAKARNCVKQYMRWRKQTNIEIVQTEKGGVSELYQYGGTYDGLGRNSDGELVLIDWKTSGGVWASYLIQLAAYDQINFEKTGERVKEFHLLRMDKENADFAHKSWLDLSDGFEAFKHMRALYELQYQLGRRAR
jgi:hypothetical protein